MLAEYLKDNIQIIDGGGIDWQEAIKISAKPLLESKSIQEEYVDSIITIAKKEGPYMNIGSKIVLAHARPLKSTKKVSLSLLKTEKEISFIDDNHDAQLWFVLAAVDNESHLDVIRDLSRLLMNKEAVSAILNSTTVEEIIKITTEE